MLRLAPSTVEPRQTARKVGAPASAACHPHAFGSCRPCLHNSNQSGHSARSVYHPWVGQRAARLRVQAVVIDEDDLMQFEDRVDWYETKFAAADMPEWNKARFVRAYDVAPGLRNVTLEVEIGREKVALTNAYKAAGQKAVVRVNNGFQYDLTVASPPHPIAINRDSIFKIRGDLFAHQIKLTTEPISVLAEVDLLVSKEEAPEVFNLSEDDNVEAGPFQGAGMDLRETQIHAIYRYPTLVLLVEGRGIAAARALVEAPAEGNGLLMNFRQNTVMYYKVPNDASICYRERFADWEQLGCRVVTTTASFQDAFDDDNLFEYEPQATAAIILTGGDEEAAKAAHAMCAEAEIALVTTDVVEQTAPVYHSATPKGFQRWSKKKTGAGL